MKNIVKPVFPFLIVLIIGVIGMQISGLLTRSDAEERGIPKFTSDEAYRVFEESKRLEAEGRLDAAEELRTKARRIEAEARARKSEGDRDREPKEREREGDRKQEPKERILSEEAFSLLKKAKALRSEGRVEAAEELEVKAKRIETEARARKGEGDRDREPKERMISEEARELLQKAKALRAEGRIEAAEELEVEAKRIEREIRGREREGDRDRERPEERPRRDLIDELRRELLSAERRVAELSRRLGPRHPELIGAKEAMGMLEKQLTLVKAERVAQEYKEAGKRPPEEILRILNEPRKIRDRDRERPEERPRRDLVDELRGELLAAQRRVEELSSRMTPRHPELIGAEEAMGMLERQLTLVKAERVAQEYKEAGKRPPEEILRILNEPREIQERERREGARAEAEGAMREHFQMARRLRAEGRMDAADMHLREAEAIRRELEGMRPPREGEERERIIIRRDERPRQERPVPRREPPVAEQIAAEVRELRGDVNRLREELGEVRELLRILIEQREEGRR